MASGQVLQKLRNYYAKAEDEVRKWDIAQVRGDNSLVIWRQRISMKSDSNEQLNLFLGFLQERLVSLLGTITNILGREQVSIAI